MSDRPLQSATSQEILYGAGRLCTKMVIQTNITSVGLYEDARFLIQGMAQEISALREELAEALAERDIARVQREQMANANAALESEIRRLLGELETARAKNGALMRRFMETR